MLENYKEIREGLQKGPGHRVAIAAAADAEVLEAVCMMLKEGFAEPILFGDAVKIAKLAETAGLDSAALRVVDEPDGAAAALRAAKSVRDGEAEVLMKGLVNTSDFLRAVLDGENGIRGESLLSHLAAFETPGCPRLIIQTDGGMNLYPTLDEKVGILKNAVEALHRLGVECPKVAALSANEAVNPKMVSSVDADALAKMNTAGEIEGCIVEGPVALDVALSADAAKRKKIESRIAGETDLFLVPNIDAGNIMGKTLVCCTHAKMAGVVLGAKAPIVLVSRSDNAESKLNSLALACALA
ncbi:MAG: bifunctional enoyl-CoA hydratase/phosphate acetyltransferase [Clostridiales bacterium]|nr:bifunctional enoyl-CoA hydratase/phosphate acetyltransferase [Clostridiales bacterium]